MKFKFIILFLSIIFLTACSADYTLYIDNGFKEQIVISPSNSSESSTILNFDRDIAIYDEEDVEDIETGGLVGNPEKYKYTKTDGNLRVSAKYKTFENYVKSSTFNACFNKVIYSIDHKVYRIDTDNIFNCFDKYDNFNDITINFVTDKYVITHNADVVNGNIYSWTFKKTDIKNKSIIFEYTDKTEKEYKKSSKYNKNNNSNKNNTSSNQTDVNKNNTLLFILCLLLSFLVIFGIIVFRKKK